jgi:hypothetical protein
MNNEINPLLITLYVDSLTYAYCWSAFLCRIMHFVTPSLLSFSSNFIVIRVSPSTHEYIYKHVDTCINVHARIHIYMHIGTYIFIHVYTYMYINTLYICNILNVTYLIYIISLGFLLGEETRHNK